MKSSDVYAVSDPRITRSRGYINLLVDDFRTVALVDERTGNPMEFGFEAMSMVVRHIPISEFEYFDKMWLSADFYAPGWESVHHKFRLKKC